PVPCVLHSGTPAIHRVLRNSTYNLTSQAFYAVFHLVVIYILAHALGKQGFGEYYTFFALIIVFQLILEMGVGTVLTCRISQRPDALSQIVPEGASLFLLISVASLAAFLLMGMIEAWLRESPEYFLAFLLAGVTCA